MNPPTLSPALIMLVVSLFVTVIELSTIEMNSGRVWLVVDPMKPPEAKFDFNLKFWIWLFEMLTFPDSKYPEKIKKKKEFVDEK